MKKTMMVFGVVFVAVISGCKNKDSYKGHQPEGLKYTSVDMRSFHEEITIPKKLWVEFEEVYKPLALDGQEAYSEDSASTMPSLNESEKDDEDLLKKRPPTEPFDFTVYLVEETPGVLDGNHYELKFFDGSGVLDLRRFVSDKKKGTVRMVVQIEEDLDPENVKIFYISQSKKREIRGKAAGNGCNRYFDLTKYWIKTMSHDGIILNTRDEKYVSLTSGIYSIVSSVKGRLRLAHLLVRDSRHLDLMCAIES